MNEYYQFLASLNAITNLERRMLKVSRILNLNDLFELRPYLRVNRTKRSKLEEIRKKAATIYGMVCFSNNWHEPLLWGHYAERNKGIALGFEIISSKYRIQQVTYPTERDDPFGENIDNISVDEYICALGYKKYKNWSYENEYRFFIKLNECVNIEGNYFIKYGNDLKLTKVLIGPEHPYKNKDNYSDTAKYIVELVRDAGAELIVTRPEYQGYNIIKDTKWTKRLQDL
ncbi:MAG: DUF2971 domain-containing protein [Spirochaetes bacterium]|nr:DUF2971 domain-containing protein [Spirochaetota bacterium]